MAQHTQSPLSFANISGKKVQATFDAGALSSDGGVLFLRTLESQLGLIQRLSEAIVDHRHPSYIEHS